MSEVFNKDYLVQYITKIERLELEKSNLAEEIKDVMQDAKNNGFDIKTLRQVLKLRKMDKEKLEQEDELLALYREAVGI